LRYITADAYTAMRELLWIEEEEPDEILVHYSAAVAYQAIVATRQAETAYLTGQRVVQLPSVSY